LILQDYQSTWPDAFEQLKAVYQKTLGELAIAIEHVGSTSIPGIKAKPVIDIDIVIEDYDIFPRVSARLEKLGYRHNGDQGILHREAFKRPDERIPFTEPGGTWINHHLYVCPEFSESLKRHLLFRNYLRINEAARREYERIKLEIVARANDDRKIYAAIKEDEYGSFFERTLAAARDHYDSNAEEEA